jgi:hypothetical protein
VRPNARILWEGRGGEDGGGILALPFWFRTPPAINLLCCWCHVREKKAWGRKRRMLQCEEEHCPSCLLLAWRSMEALDGLKKARFAYWAFMGQIYPYLIN